MVGIEANAFGIPIITTNTGGLTTLVEDGINGFGFDLTADYKHFSNIIFSLFNDKDKYRELCNTSRVNYDSKNNWNATINLILDKITNSSS